MAFIQDKLSTILFYNGKSDWLRRVSNPLFLTAVLHVICYTTKPGGFFSLNSLYILYSHYTHRLFQNDVLFIGIVLALTKSPPLSLRLIPPHILEPNNR